MCVYIIYIYIYTYIHYTGVYMHCIRVNINISNRKYV